LFSAPDMNPEFSLAELELFKYCSYGWQTSFPGLCFKK